MKYILAFGLVCGLFSCSQNSVEKETLINSTNSTQQEVVVGKQAEGFTDKNEITLEVPQEKREEPLQQQFLANGLKTNTAKKSIDLDLVLDGGPGKDGIPAIHNPKFVDIVQAKQQMSYLEDETLGIAVNLNGASRFYPYPILYWHEIVNDSFGEAKVSVTFCPLCGSAIVFDRMVEGQLLDFGVSGKLYESNLLMYDNKTESLWSQSLGEAVVGESTGMILKHIASNVMTFKEFEQAYPTGTILSDDTGYARQYGVIPYTGYEQSDNLYFPVSGEDDTSFHKKEIFFIVNHENNSLAFHMNDLKEVKTAQIETNTGTYTATYNEGILEVRKGKTIIPGYYEMWFSWRNHHPDSDSIWYKK